MLAGSLRLYGELTGSVNANRLSHLGIALGVGLLGCWVMLPRNNKARGSAPPSASLLDGTTLR
jgi:hypothetical protein